MDRNRVCSEYWDSRPYSRPQVQIPQKAPLNDQEAAGVSLLSSGVDAILGGLFKKANLEELNSLYSILSDNQQTVGRGLVTRLLNEGIQTRRPT